MIIPLPCQGLTRISQKNIKQKEYTRCSNS